MNSASGLKGFTTLLFLGSILLFLFTGYRYFSNLANTTKARNGNTKEEFQSLVQGKSIQKSIKDHSGIREMDSYGIKEVFEQKVLGIQDETGISPASRKTSPADTRAVSEFKEALLFNDLRYDFNKDETVTNQDYPLFLEFIKNAED